MLRSMAIKMIWKNNYCLKEKEIALKDSLDHDIDINLNEFKQKAYEIKISPNASSDFFNKSCLYYPTSLSRNISIYYQNIYQREKHNSPATTEENLLKMRYYLKIRLISLLQKNLLLCYMKTPMLFIYHSWRPIPILVRNYLN